MRLTVLFSSADESALIDRPLTSRGAAIVVQTGHFWGTQVWIRPGEALFKFVFVLFRRLVYPISCNWLVKRFCHASFAIGAPWQPDLQYISLAYIHLEFISTRSLVSWGN